MKVRIHVGCYIQLSYDILKEVRYNCSAHRSAHLFIIARSSHSHIKRKQPQRIFLQYCCSVTVINIAKKHLRWNTWTKHLHQISWWFLASDIEKICCKKSSVAELLLVAVSALLLSSAYKTSGFFTEINLVAHIFFHLKSFLSKGPLLKQSKLEKKSSIRFWTTPVPRLIDDLVQKMSQTQS